MFLLLNFPDVFWFFMFSLISPDVPPSQENTKTKELQAVQSKPLKIRKNTEKVGRFQKKQERSLNNQGSQLKTCMCCFV